MTTSALPTREGRSVEVPDLKVLKSPEEGGTKKEYDDFLDKIGRYVSIAWANGSDVAHVLIHKESPVIAMPDNLTENEKKSDALSMRWKKDFDIAYMREVDLRQNMIAAYSLVVMNLSKFIKGKVEAKPDYTKASLKYDLLWLLDVVEDIMIKFEDVKSRHLSLDTQHVRIANYKQNNMTNSDFIKSFMKEVKIYERRGFPYLWAQEDERILLERVSNRKLEYAKIEGTEMPASDVATYRKLQKKLLHDKMLAMALLKRVDKRRFSKLQMRLNNDFLFGKVNNYPDTPAELLKILNNFEQEEPPPPVEDDSTRATGRNNNRNNSVSFLQTNADDSNVWGPFESKQQHSHQSQLGSP